MCPVSKGINVGVKDLTKIEAACGTAANLSFDHIELNLEGPVYREYWESRVTDIRTILEQHELDLTVHLPWLELHLGSPREHIREAAIEELKAYIEIGEMLDAEKGVIHLSSNAHETPGFERSDILELMADSVTRLDKFAADRGIELCAENGGSFVTVYEFDELATQTDVSFTLDTGHAWCSGMHPDEQPSFVDQHHDRISHFHLNDTRRAVDEHLPFGAGNINFSNIFDVLMEHDWEGTLLLEMNLSSDTYIEQSKAELDALV